MRKNEMSKDQLAIRQTIIARLDKTGWSESEALSGFDRGDFEPEEVIMEYNGLMNITVSYNASENLIHLIMESWLGGPSVALEINFLDRLNELLDLIVSFQDKVTEHNFRKYVAKVVEVCPEVYVDLGDIGLVRLDNKAP